MRKLFKALLMGLILGPSLGLSAPQIIGPGGTTAFYIDNDNDGCGTGKRADNNYILHEYSGIQSGKKIDLPLGDTPDADDTDPTVCTTADWQSKWIAVAPYSTDGQCMVAFASCSAKQQNQAMINFLNARKGFTNTTRIWYLAPLTGNDATASVNDPTHPFQSMACIVGGPAYTHVGTGGNISFNCATSGSNPSNPQDLKGGAVIVRAGDYVDNGSGLYLSPCSIPANSGGKLGPCWELSGSPGFKFLLMSYPGEVVLDESVDSGGQFINSTGGFAPFKNYCCVIIDGFEFRNGGTASATGWGNGQGITLSFASDWIVQNCEFTGGDKAAYYGASINMTNIGNVVHNENNHAFYYGPVGLGYMQNAAGGDFNFALDQNIMTQHAGHAFVGTGNVTSGSNVLTITAVSFGHLYAPDPIEGPGLPPGIPLAGSDIQLLYQLTGTDGSACSPTGGMTAVCNGLTGTYRMNCSTTGPSCIGITTGTGIQVIVNDGGASYYNNTINNVMYDNGNGGFEPIHYNTIHFYPLIEGNIVSYSGGNGMSMQAGSTGAVIANNIFFDNGRDCIGIQHGVESTIQYTHVHGQILNNICWQGDITVSAGSFDSSGQMNLSATNGVVNYTLQANSVISGALQPGDLVQGPSMPGTTTVASYGTASFSPAFNGGTTGSYHMTWTNLGTYFVTGTTATGCPANESWCGTGVVNDAVLTVTANTGGILSAGNVVKGNGYTGLNAAVGTGGTGTGSCNNCTYNMTIPLLTTNGTFAAAIRGTTPFNGMDMITNNHPYGNQPTNIGQYVKYWTVKGNIFVAYVGAPSSNNAVIQFQGNTFPETFSISGNTMWSVFAGNPTSATVAVCGQGSPGTGQCAPAPAPQGLWGAGGQELPASPAVTCAVSYCLYNFAQFQAGAWVAPTSFNYAGNKFADPRFGNATLLLARAPGNFNFNTCSNTVVMLRNPDGRLRPAMYAPTRGTPCTNPVFRNYHTPTVH